MEHSIQRVSCRIGYGDNETRMQGVLTGGYYSEFVSPEVNEEWIEVKLDTGSIHYFREEDIKKL